MSWLKYEMISIPFVFTELIYTAIWLCGRLAVWLTQKKINWRREALLLLIYINFAVIIRVAFFPMSRVNGRVQPLVFYAVTAYPFRVNLTPFINLFDYDNKRDLLLNVIGNCTLFIPTGIILPIVYKRLNNFWKVLFSGVLISLFIEILQLPFSVRASDVDDLILNTAGAAVGYWIYFLIKRFVKVKKSPNPTEN